MYNFRTYYTLNTFILFNYNTLFQYLISFTIEILFNLFFFNIKIFKKTMKNQKKAVFEGGRRH